jgi:hypothetical protein
MLRRQMSEKLNGRNAACCYSRAILPFHETEGDNLG